MTVIVGENGAGKSTVIEALASLSYGAGREGFTQFPLRKGTSTGQIALYQSGQSRPVAVWDAAASKADELPETRYLLAYGRYRRVFGREETDAGQRNPAVLLDAMASRAADSRTLTLNQPDNNLLRDVSQYLVALDFGRASDPRLEGVWQQLGAALPKMDPRLRDLQCLDAVPAVVRNGITLGFQELSDGYQSLLVILFDLALRYPYLFPLLANPLEGEATVAIDEVDLHLHPRWQRTVVSQVADLFPRTQFVVTTHSPVVVQGAIDSKRTVISLREQGEAVVARPLGSGVLRRLRGAEVGSLLLENLLFDVESRYSTQFSKLERRVDELQRRVSSGVASQEDYQALQRALEIMEGLVAREDERRADTSTVAQMTKLRAAFVKDLITELKKARS